MENKDFDPKNPAKKDEKKAKKEKYEKPQIIIYSKRRNMFSAGGALALQWHCLQGNLVYLESSFQLFHLSILII